MSYANGTTHYNLPQTVGTDKRDWSDTNQAFADVDAALHTASETASSAASNISTLDNQINGSGGIDSRLTTAEADINTAEGAISTLQTTVSGQATEISETRSDLEDMVVAYNEASATSTHAYVIDDPFIYNDVLYIATDAIAVGDTIVPNTNCRATNIMTEIGTINTALSNIERELASTGDVLISTVVNGTGKTNPSSPFSGYERVEVEVGAYYRAGDANLYRETYEFELNSLSNNDQSDFAYYWNNGTSSLFAGFTICNGQFSVVELSGNTTDFGLFIEVRGFEV